MLKNINKIDEDFQMCRKPIIIKDNKNDQYIYKRKINSEKHELCPYGIL